MATRVAQPSFLPRLVLYVQMPGRGVQGRISSSNNFHQYVLKEHLVSQKNLLHEVSMSPRQCLCSNFVVWNFSREADGWFTRFNIFPPLFPPHRGFVKLAGWYLLCFPVGDRKRWPARYSTKVRFLC